ncbi:MAG: glycosyltransferase [Gammaproteobacteria bacterium]|nr:MAG: glycosyltransferase [Gammaproteobacteria bacterium]
MKAEPGVSVVIPARNEAACLPALLADLQAQQPPPREIIVVDGGSTDDTPDLARRGGARVLESPPGRARQMNAGAAAASGEVLWFLHADTRLPAEAMQRLLAALSSHHWGRFSVRLSGTHAAFRIIERMMNLRSCLTGICTGDQGLFVTRSVFDEAGGFPDLPLMEDIELSRALLRSAGRPACVRSPLVTSSRRWERGGILRTVLLMWWLRLAWWLGVPAERLAGWYR